MKRTDGSTGFWEPGASIVADELTNEEKSLLAPLRAQLKTVTDPARRDELKRAIAAVRAEFKRKRKNARSSLFAKG